MYSLIKKKEEEEKKEKWMVKKWKLETGDGYYLSLGYYKN